ncbi:MAG: DUF488 domain-containing protein [Bacteroidota bacterium]
MIKLYTIGFTKKSAEQFFHLLTKHTVKQIVDTRVNVKSQLAGFAKGRDLSFLAKAVADIDYEHELDFAPTKELLARYRKKEMTWEEYEVEYLNLLDMRKVKSKTNIEQLHQNCLLCSEHEADKCHRRLLAEYFQAARNDVEIIHLME